MRLHRLRRDDQGFALIFTLFVTTMVMIAVAAALTITTPNIVNSKNTQDTAAALLAAQSGIQDSVAYLTNIPACRSQTRICPQALGADSVTLNRPGLGGQQSFHWTTNSQAVPLVDSGGNVINSQGFVRVTSTGTEGTTSRTLVADLSLSPSILAYGYYSNYESQTPSFLNTFWASRKIYINNSTTYGSINPNYTSGTSAPQTITWNGAGNSPPSGYSDAVCGQHWYAEGSSSPGRAAAATAQKSTQTQWAESGTLNGNTVYNVGSCDLVFTAGMVENGPTYTRDALDIANGTGNGPSFNAPVYTLWGYGSNTTPTPSTTQPWRQADGAGYDLLPNSTYKPQIATSDITLPSSIGTNGVENTSCVYYGPTRVVLNGDGTATVTSPETTSASAGADAGCYPSTVSQGIFGYTYNYTTVGSGTIYVKNLNTPTAGWPNTTLTSTSTPSSSNEVFYIPAQGGATTNPNSNSSSAPSSGCTTSTKYSAANNATCAWTGVATTTDATSSTGWTAYSTSKTCSQISTTSTDRQAFECDYSKIAGQSKAPGSGGYAAIRSAIQTNIAKNSCLTGANSTQATCLAAFASTALSGYNTSSYRYVTSTSVGTPSSNTTTIGSTPTSPVANDSLFTTTPSAAASGTDTLTPITVTVSRQIYNSSSKTWGSSVAQFSYTVTQSVWSFTPATVGTSYFPQTSDITPYAMGSTATGAASGTAGPDQPGDLYVEGVNQGNLSLIAQNNVELTGNLTKGANQDTSQSNPVSITAGNDIRNYHPVSCVDQSASDVNATSAGWCPNDITGVQNGSLLNSDGSYTAQHPGAQYTDMPTTSSNTNGIGDRTVDAALFALNGSLRTDNFDRGQYVGKLIVNGGIYEDFRGANGVNFANGKNTPGQAGTSLNYTWVDLERANLQYVPSASYSNNPRVWNVVSVSDGANPTKVGS